MKYAAKPQILNPNKLPGVDNFDIWEKIEFDDTIPGIETSLLSQGWYVQSNDVFTNMFAQLRREKEAHDLCPKEVTPRQARQALLLVGVTTEMIVGAINSLPNPTRNFALVEWEYSVMFIRANPLVNTMGQMLGWTQYQLDCLWIQASKM